MRFAQDFKDRDRLWEKRGPRGQETVGMGDPIFSPAEEDKDLSAYLEPTLVSGRYALKN